MHRDVTATLISAVEPVASPNEMKQAAWLYALGRPRLSARAFGDTAGVSAASPGPTRNVEVVAEDSVRFLLRFAEPSPEHPYDATYRVRVSPKHSGWSGESGVVLLALAADSAVSD